MRHGGWRHGKESIGSSAILVQAYRRTWRRRRRCCCSICEGAGLPVGAGETSYSAVVVKTGFRVQGAGAGSNGQRDAPSILIGACRCSTTTSGFRAPSPPLSPGAEGELAH